jgi:hypothetical protein
MWRSLINKTYAVGAVMAGLDGHPEGTRNLQTYLLFTWCGWYNRPHQAKKSIFGGGFAAPTPTVFVM